MAEYATTEMSRLFCFFGWRSCLPYMPSHTPLQSLTLVSFRCALSPHTGRRGQAADIPRRVEGRAASPGPSHHPQINEDCTHQNPPLNDRIREAFLGNGSRSHSQFVARPRRAEPQTVSQASVSQRLYPFLKAHGLLISEVESQKLWDVLHVDTKLLV